ncbi:carboxypeptidase Q-like [Lycorma delicatula]|uniref:carboxypeptidase Q-like n=1 Tax=Lycorma delicatula TaxID=130591 RepID=UPI003F5116EB
MNNFFINKTNLIILFSIIAFNEGFLCGFDAETYLLSEINESFDDFSSIECYVDEYVTKKIAEYQPTVNKIVKSVTEGKFKGKVYNELGNFIDKFGGRLTGTQNLEDSIDYMLNLLSSYNLENVHGESVVVPHWIRGRESAALILPRPQKMHITGLGGSISTPPEGIVAEAIVVNTFDELYRRAEEAKGKIVVYNQKQTSYLDSVKYRIAGAVEAAKVGAVASLVRSIGYFSINTPHAGQQQYNDNVKKIPTASITIEDAHMLQRMSKRGGKIVIRLYMEARSEENKTSRNILAQIGGTQKQKNVVLLSGHIDSWDNGRGALDDGAGSFVSWFSVALLKSLELRPQRTVRVALWTGEEQGLYGVKQYAKDHEDELKNFSMVMESDEGTFNPQGVKFTGSADAACIVREVTKLMKPINATQFQNGKTVSSDITVLTKLGIPGATVLNNNTMYTWFHHTSGDTMSVLNSDDLDKNVAMYASLAYVIADMPVELPKRKQ